MARINVDDEIFRDARFQQLSRRIGFDLALGLLVGFWFAAQRRWGQGELLPEHEFVSEWEPIISVGLAIRTEAGIRACGSEKQFDWYRQRIDAGKRSAVARKEKFGSAQPTRSSERESNENRTRTERRSNGVRVIAEPPTPTHTHTHKEKKRESSGDDSHPLLEIYHANLGHKLPRVREFNASRKRKAVARWRLNPEPEYWHRVCARILESDFLIGINDRGWRANFDWFIRPDTTAKILEGKYDNKTKKQVFSFSGFNQTGEKQ